MFSSGLLDTATVYEVDTEGTSDGYGGITKKKTVYSTTYKCRVTTYVSTDDEELSRLREAGYSKMNFKFCSGERDDNIKRGWEFSIGDAIYIVVKVMPQRNMYRTNHNRYILLEVEQ
jgi:hypothetical protein